jgi:hypothetical protein
MKSASTVQYARLVEDGSGKYRFYSPFHADYLSVFRPGVEGHTVNGMDALEKLTAFDPGDGLGAWTVEKFFSGREILLRRSVILRRVELHYAVEKGWYWVGDVVTDSVEQNLSEALLPPRESTTNTTPYRSTQAPPFAEDNLETLIEVAGRLGATGWRVVSDLRGHTAQPTWRCTFYHYTPAEDSPQ